MVAWRVREVAQKYTQSIIHFPLPIVISLSANKQNYITKYHHAMKSHKIVYLACCLSLSVLGLELFGPGAGY
jgi:hypothetical protein